ncbi:MAG: NADP-dependent phosphogluconate dehydrogenase, partial [Gammaproteobacteria bacterium]|nr:NADP-dependent phosphogluconate dehydrogenase [Gammaproteobacteria bacterium]
GKWTGINALELGVPLTLIGEAVFSRYLSSLKSERMQAAKVLSGPEKTAFTGNKVEYIAAVRDALYASKIISYAQGFMLMRQADKEYQWDLRYGDIALMWRGGCIIRSGFLGNIKEAYARNENLENLLLDEFFLQAINDAQAGWRKTIMLAVELGIPVPAFSSALAFYDGYRHETLPANLLQAQRDYFGAHTYQRVDQPLEKAFHTDWIGNKQEMSV